MSTSGKEDILRYVMEKIYDRNGYKLSILWELLQGPKRFVELRRTLGIHQNTLTTLLQQLEKEPMPLVTKLGDNRNTKYGITIHGRAVLQILGLIENIYRGTVRVKAKPQGDTGNKIIVRPLFSQRYLSELRKILLSVRGDAEPEEIIKKILNYYDEKMTPIIDSNYTHAHSVYVGELILYPGAEHDKVLTYLDKRDLRRYWEATSLYSRYYTKIIIKTKEYETFLQKLKEFIEGIDIMFNYIIPNTITYIEKITKNQWTNMYLKNLLNYPKSPVLPEHVNQLNFILILGKTKNEETYEKNEYSINLSDILNEIRTSSIIGLHIVRGNDIDDEVLKRIVINIDVLINHVVQCISVNVYRFNAPRICIQVERWARHGEKQKKPRDIFMPVILYRKHRFGSRKNDYIVSDIDVACYCNTGFTCKDVNSIGDSRKFSTIGISKARDTLCDEYICIPSQSSEKDTPQLNIRMLYTPLITFTGCLEINEVDMKRPGRRRKGGV